MARSKALSSCSYMLLMACEFWTVRSKRPVPSSARAFASWLLLAKMVASPRADETLASARATLCWASRSSPWWRALSCFSWSSWDCCSCWTTIDRCCFASNNASSTASSRWRSASSWACRSLPWCARRSFSRASCTLRCVWDSSFSARRRTESCSCSCSCTRLCSLLICCRSWFFSLILSSRACCSWPFSRDSTAMRWSISAHMSPSCLAIAVVRRSTSSASILSLPSSFRLSPRVFVSSSIVSES
mmetsp:Transcript_44160/g.99587  ORF Transcript_44160/g.99587 Transcript_44160/m.99587 type:complete len:246 (-) Transcript_44160:231-968(-)